MGIDEVGIDKVGIDKVGITPWNRNVYRIKVCAIHVQYKAITCAHGLFLLCTSVVCIIHGIPV